MPDRYRVELLGTTYRVVDSEWGTEPDFGDVCTTGHVVLDQGAEEPQPGRDRAERVAAALNYVQALDLDELLDALHADLTEGPVLAAVEWITNAAMIADAARLGYLDGMVLDATYGEGAFWTLWRPEKLNTNDLYKPADTNHNYRALPWAHGDFDAVVFDPPYKLNGTPALDQQDDAYGTDRRTSRSEVLDDIVAGATECYRITRNHLLVKCKDQVEGGQVRWQTDLITRAIEDLGGRKKDRLDFLNVGRPQPGNRRQRTARRNYSTLLVFEKPKTARRPEPML